MIVGVIGKTSRIVAIVQQINGVSDTIFTMDGQQMEACDVVFLDNVASKEMETYGNDYPKYNMVYVMDVRSGLRSEYGLLKELCSVKGIPFLSDHSERGLQEELERYLFPKRYEGRLQPSLSLISSHRKSGACEIANALCTQIAAKTTGHIGLVKLDPYDVLSTNHSFSQLYREFEVGGLSPSRIKEIAEKRDDTFFHLSGNGKIDVARSLHPHKLEQIYTLIQSAFDLTIFIVYPYWDNAMTLVALKNIQRKYVVATSKRDEMREFYAFMPQIRHQFELDLRSNSFIYNFEGQGAEAKSSVSHQLQSGCVLQLPYVPGPSPMNSRYTQQGLQKLAQSIVEEYRLPQIETQKGKKSWFRKMAIG